MIRNSLSRQLFAIIAGFSVLLLALLGGLLLTTVEKQVRDMDRQLSEHQQSQLRLMMDFSIQTQTTLNQILMENHQQDLAALIEPKLQAARSLEADVITGRITRDKAVSRLISQLQHLEHEHGTHYWLHQDNGGWVFHPHGEPSKLSKRHQQALETFISMVVENGSASDMVLWSGSDFLDAKPVLAHHLPDLGIVLGADFSISDLPRAPIESYQMIDETLDKIMEGARFGKLGQVFYLLSDMDYSTTAGTENLHTIIESVKNPLTGNLYIDDIRQAAHSGKPLELLWNTLDDPDNYIHPAVARVFYYPDYEFFLVSITYPEDINRHANTVRSYVIAVLVLCVLIALIMAWWLAQRVVHPIRRLSDYAQRVGSGQLQLRSTLEREDELGILSRELNKMVERLESTIDGLDKTVQARTAELNQQNQHLSVSLKDKEALLREVHHRVKNNLAVIIGFIQLQQRRHKNSPIDPLLRDLRTRIYTIELIHNQLYRADNFSHINPENYYRALIEEIWVLHHPATGITYELNIAVKEQPLEQLLTCGQLLNELVSNSLKYAFTNRETGLLSINLDMDGDYLQLHVKDNGCGLTDTAHLPDNGLGMTLIQHLVQSKLKGQLNWQSSDAGLCWEIQFPLAFRLTGVA